MPTISKIPMSGYSPIFNGKSNQKASNPISTNNQNSASLNMSPNAHYGRHAVSFKATIPFEEAKRFVRDFSLPNVSGYELESAVHSGTDTLLKIAGDHESLKDQALGQFSGLLNHENHEVRKAAIACIPEPKRWTPSLATPELLHHIVSFLKKDQFEETYLYALNTLAKFIEVNPAVVKPQILTPELVNKPARVVLNGQDILSLYKTGLFNNITTFTKINPAIFHDFIPEIKMGLHDKTLEKSALGTVRDSAEHIKPEVVLELLEHIKPLTHADCESTRSIALKTIGKLAKVNHSIVTPELMNNDILPGLEDNHYDVKNETLNTIDICIQINPAIATEDIHNKVKSFTLLDRNISGVKKTATRVCKKLKFAIEREKNRKAMVALSSVQENKADIPYLDPIILKNIQSFLPKRKVVPRQMTTNVARPQASTESLPRLRNFRLAPNNG